MFNLKNITVLMSVGFVALPFAAHADATPAFGQQIEIIEDYLENSPQNREIEVIKNENLQKRPTLVDTVAKSQFKSIAHSGAKYAKKKLEDLIYKNHQLHGVVDETGQSVTIYNNHPNMAQLIFKNITGMSIVDLGLPNQLSGLIIEKIITEVINPFSTKAVERLTEEGLYAVYLHGKNYSIDYFKSLFVKTTAPEVAKSKKGKTGLTQEDLAHLHEIDPELYAELTNGEPTELTYNDVADYYLMRIKAYVNEQFRAAIMAGIVFGIENLIDYNIATIETVGTALNTAILVLTGSNPLAMAGYAVFGAAISDAGATYLTNNSHKLAVRFAEAVTSQMSYEIWPATPRQILQPKQKIFYREIEDIRTDNRAEDLEMYSGVLGPQYKFEYKNAEEGPKVAVRVVQEDPTPMTEKEKSLYSGFSEMVTYNTPTVSNYLGGKVDSVKATVSESATKVKEFLSEAAESSAKKTVTFFSKAKKLVTFWK